MSDLRVGRIIKSVRLHEDRSQADVTAPVGVHRSVMTDLEAGRLEDVSLRTARRLCAQLEIELVVEARWRGGAIDRLLDRGHAAIVEVVVERLQAAAWVVEPEFTFNFFGDRGSVDVLGWHPRYRALLIVEVKTAITDLQDLLMTMSRKVRVVPPMVRTERGWDRSAFGRLLVASGTTANRGVIERHRSIFDAAIPGRTAAARAWLRTPVGDFAGVWLVSTAAVAHGEKRSSRTRRSGRA
jgi:DNA-binding XRE family transcriptional regulator